MKNAVIKQLVLGLEDRSPYLEAVRRRFFPRQQTLTAANLLAVVMADPAFGWHLVSSYARARRPLPNEIGWVSVWRAFCALIWEEEKRAKDPECFEAIALGHPASRVKQVMVKALLCSGLTYEEVGKRCGISGDVVELYAHLFFDFVERSEDQLFVARVLNPRTRLTTASQEGGHDPHLLLMNIGYRLGPEAVIKALGLSDERSIPGEENQPATSIKRAILSAGEMKAKLGLLSTGDPAYGLVKALAVEEAKQEEPKSYFEDPLAAMSCSQSIQATFKALMQERALETLAASKTLDSHQAAAEAAKAAPGKAEIPVPAAS